MNQQLKIFNGKMILPDRISNGGSIIITNGKITEVSDRDIATENATLIDAGGKYISPGFIDMHVHGGGGHDFMDGTVHAFLEIAEIHARYGTTSMFPTTLTSSKDDLLNTLDIYEEANEKNHEGAQFLGMHLEGPYIAKTQAGAQDPRYIRDPDPAEYEDILHRYTSIKRWSAAPELPGALKFGECLRSKNILPAIAHTDAVYEDVLKAYESGYTHLTHFYSAMSGVTRRNGFRCAGVVESGYLMDELTVEIIADGIHLPAPFLQLIHKIKGVQRTALITDAVRGAGMPPGEIILGSLKHGIKAIVEDGVAKLPDRSAFAGSVATTDRLVRNMISLAGLPLHDAVMMMAATPARIMGVFDKKGSLVVGKDADVLIFDDDIRIKMTMVNGKIVYRAD
ncbi:MAG: N-acetylglucosamine-6-phosphate deacetylase [Bacteroidetes bacterium]|nr:N-acetylglucosamine-6-phosphate deacetylase [Bacteroidota bacterium]